MKPVHVTMKYGHCSMKQCCITMKLEHMAIIEGDITIK